MKRFADFWDEKSRFVFYSSVIIMILAHGFCFMNIMYSHDSLFFYTGDVISKVRLGRWLYALFYQSRFIAAPWMIGALSILFISLGSVLVTRTFDLSKIQGVCAAIVFATNITITSLLCTYIFDADANCMAMLLACFAVYSFKTFPKVLNIIVPVISLVFCLALYQAFICVALGLFVMLLICESKGLSNWKDVIKVYLTGLKALFVVAAATIIYIPLMHAAANHYHTNLGNDYNGPEHLNTLTLNKLIQAIPKAYAYFKNYFFKINEYNTSVMVTINRVLLLVLILSVIIYIWENKKNFCSLAVMIPSILIMPLALNAIFLVSMGMMHTLMIFSFNLAFLVPLVLINFALDIKPAAGEKKTNSKRIVNYAYAAAVILFFIIGFHNIVYSNGAYQLKKLVYDNTALHAQTIWKDINNIESYKEGETKVVFMGDFSSSKAAYISPLGTRYWNVIVGASTSSITYSATINRFYYGILGRRMNISYNDAEILQTREYLQMLAYPVNGYCKMIGEKLVVKMN